MSKAKKKFFVIFGTLLFINLCGIIYTSYTHKQNNQHRLSNIKARQQEYLKNTSQALDQKSY